MQRTPGCGRQRKLPTALDDSLRKGGAKHSPNDKGGLDKAMTFFL